MSTKRIAIVHEWLSTYGGSERILVEMLGLYSQADIFALTYFPENFQGTALQDRSVTTSWLQSIPGIENLYRGLLPIMPFAIESLNVHEYETVISLSHAVAHGVRTKPGQLHISYISTPMRYAWHMRDEYIKLHKLDFPLLRDAARLTLSLLRRWDKYAAARADFLLANSKWTAGHIREAWERECTILYPPVDVKRFSPFSQREDFYLLVSRLVPYKMSLEIIEAFNQLGLPFIVAGDGPELPHLQKLAKRNIKLLGYQPDAVIADLMNRARAFVYMATEDFGIAMAEAQAAGCPVLAYGKGGALEIVIDGETGLLFNEQHAGSMIEAVRRFQKMKLSNKAACENAARFSKERFRLEFLDFVDGLVKY